MSEILITLPTVRYGNVKLKLSPEEMGVDVASPAALGTASAVYLNLFTQGFELGASMDVTASPTEGLKAPLAAEQSEVDRVIDETLKAAQIIADGLGSVTEISDEESEQTAAAAETEVGGKAPWTEKVDAPKRPWETEATVSAVVSEDW